MKSSTAEQIPTGQNQDMTKNLTADKQQRHQLLQSWLHQCFPEFDIQINSLPGDASFRRYHRLCLQPKTHLSDTTEHSSEQPVNHSLNYIVMDAPPELESISEFVAVGELLGTCINVPDIIARDMEHGFLVLQDFGTTEFAHIVADTTQEQVDICYKRAIDTLLELQTISLSQARQQANLPDYDAAMLTREMDLFSEWFIPYIGVRFESEQQQCWQALKEAIVEQVLTQPQVVVHRDYHSRNLMKDCASSDQLGVIDFQDAVIGAYSYDLLSLLRDAYVNWSEAQIADWIDYYYRQLSSKTIAADTAGVTLQQLTYDINIIGIQRHLKILGIFVRLSERDGKSRYLADIPKVMSDLTIELNWLSQQSALPINKAAVDFKQWLDNDILPAFERKFNQRTSDNN